MMSNIADLSKMNAQEFGKHPPELTATTKKSQFYQSKALRDERNRQKAEHQVV